MRIFNNIIWEMEKINLFIFSSSLFYGLMHQKQSPRMWWKLSTQMHKQMLRERSCERKLFTYLFGESLFFCFVYTTK